MGVAGGRGPGSAREGVVWGARCREEHAVPKCDDVRGAGRERRE